MLRRILSLLGGAVILLSGSACETFHRHATMIKIVSHKNDARLQTRMDGGTAIIEIFSESGIGNASFELIADPLPKQILLRLHLRGLEEMRFAYRDVVLTAAIASTAEQSTRQSMSQGGEKPAEAQVLTANSPFWMPMRVVSRGKIPLRDGYIEVEAPADFFASGARQVAIHWIDFYR